MPLLLVDLDNTLIDRAGAFARWAREFASARGGSAADAAWLVVADRDGFEPRERLAAMIGERFGLESRAVTGLAAELRGGLVRQIVPDDTVTGALREARAGGWVPFVVTNGTVQQQERKLRHTGLDREVAGWVISEGAGIRKPDPEIFRFAASKNEQSCGDSGAPQSVQVELPGPFGPDHDREVSAYVDGEISAAELYRRTVARYRQP